MLQNKLKIWVVCGLVVLGGSESFAQNYGSMMRSTSSWGNSGYVNDYYYGESSPFEMDENMFSYGSTATQNMGSTSSDYCGQTTLGVAARNIIPGTTLQMYNQQLSSSKGGGGWAPPTVAPIGDGLWILLLMALVYGVCVYRKRCTV